MKSVTSNCQPVSYLQSPHNDGVLRNARTEHDYRGGRNLLDSPPAASPLGMQRKHLFQAEQLAGTSADNLCTINANHEYEKE